MSRNHVLASHLLNETCGTDVVEYGLIAVALLLTVAAVGSSLTARLVTGINILDILAATCSVTAIVGFVLPLFAAVKGD